MGEGGGGVRLSRNCSNRAYSVGGGRGAYPSPVGSMDNYIRSRSRGVSERKGKVEKPRGEGFRLLWVRRLAFTGFWDRDFSKLGDLGEEGQDMMGKVDLWGALICYTYCGIRLDLGVVERACRFFFRKRVVEFGGIGIGTDHPLKEEPAIISFLGGRKRGYRNPRVPSRTQRLKPDPASPSSTPISPPPLLLPRSNDPLPNNAGPINQNTKLHPRPFPALGEMLYAHDHMAQPQPGHSAHVLARGEAEGYGPVGRVLGVSVGFW